MTGQYQDGIGVVRQLATAIGGANNMAVIGRSLGGGIASVAGPRVGAMTYTFNAAGVSSGLMADYGVTQTAIDQCVYAYINGSDGLNMFQLLTPASVAAGNRQYLRNSGLHGIQGVCLALDQTC